MNPLLEVGLSNAACAAVLAVLVGGFACLWRRPALVHGLWVLVLLKLVTPPLFPLRLHWPERNQLMSQSPATMENAPHEDFAAGARADLELKIIPAEATVEEPPGADRAVVVDSAPALEPDRAAVVDIKAADFNQVPAEQLPTAGLSWPSWQSMVIAVWLAGSCLWLMVASFRVYRFQRLLRLAEPAPPAVHSQARELAARLRIARCPPVWMVRASISPLLAALVGRPRLLLPAALWERLNPHQQATLLGHELAHCRRGDHWVRRLELAATALYWWHPALWWARRQIREAEEACCDAWVVFLFPDAVESYATALVETVAFLSQARPAVAPAASGMGYVGSLRRRLTMIMRGTTPKALSAAGFLLLVAVGLLVLPLLPTWAEADPQEPAATPAVADDGQADLPGAAGQRGVAPVNLRQRGIEEAQDEIELLRTQLMAKQAELEESKALLHQAEKSLQSKSRLSKRGVASEEDFNQAETQVEVRRAQIRAKEAQVQEAGIRLNQAERRLARLRGAYARPAASTSAASSTKAAEPAHGIVDLAAPRSAVGRSISALGSAAGQAPAVSAAEHSAGLPSSRAANPQTAARSSLGEEGQGRLGRVESKLDRLLQEMEGLRQEVGRLRSELRRLQGTLKPEIRGLAVRPDDNRPFNSVDRLRPDGTIEHKLVPNPDYIQDPRDTPTVPLRKPN